MSGPGAGVLEAMRAAGLQVSPDDAGGTACLEVPAEHWLTAATWLCREWGATLLDWLSAVDEPEAEPPAVDVVLHAVRPVSARAGEQEGVHGFHDHGEDGGRPVGPGLDRVLLRTRVPALDPVLPSVTGVWPGAAWHERETFEMFGVTFAGFEDRTSQGLRPLLLPDGFQGTPLRKSFVLAARAAKPWPGAKEPGESDTDLRHRPARRALLPPGVPDQSWGPRDAGREPAAPDGER